MIRIVSLFALAAIAVAAPVPAGREYKLKGWGDPTDPLGDCTFTVEDRTLSISLPGKRRELANAPSVLREQTGDFTISVTVGGTWPVGAKVDDKLRVPFFNAGLMLAQDEKNFLRFERAQHEWGGTVTRSLSIEFVQNGKQIQTGLLEDGKLNDDAPLHLKLTRKGDALTASYSPDGKTWTVLPRLETKFGAKLKAGVSAFHDTQAEFKPVFSEIVVE